MTKKEIGDFGETQVVQYLEHKGLEILERNFRRKTGEIDIIARDGEYTVFVEVKTRKSSGYGLPAEFVDFKKQERLRQTAFSYLQTMDAAMRFDVAEVFYVEEKDCLRVRELRYIENAF